MLCSAGIAIHMQAYIYMNTCSLCMHLHEYMCVCLCAWLCVYVCVSARACVCVRSYFKQDLQLGYTKPGYRYINHHFDQNLCSIVFLHSLPFSTAHLDFTAVQIIVINCTLKIICHVVCVCVCVYRCVCWCVMCMRVCVCVYMLTYI